MKDSEFIRGDVPMTKEEVRILTLDWLALQNAKTFVDVGAGTGSVSIEASIRFPHLETIAIERNPEAISLIQQNQQKFKVSNLTLIEGKAPLALPHKKMDAIFIGGSGGSLKEIIKWSYEHLIEGGRLVLNFILLDNLMDALSILKSFDFSEINTTQIQVLRLTKLGPGDYFKANNPTYIISAIKGENHDDE